MCEGVQEGHMVYVRGCKGVIKGVQGGLRRAYWVCECMQRGHMGCVRGFRGSLQGV